MSKSHSTLKIHRLVGAVILRPTLKYLQNIANVAETLESQYAEWNAPSETNIILNSPAEKKEIRISPNAITYYNEDDATFERSQVSVIGEAADYLTQLLKRAADEFSIKEIRRVGFQITQIVESPFNFNDLVDLIYRKFYSPETDIRHISCDKIKDVAFILDAVKNGFSNHVSIGPVEGMEALRRVSPLYANIAPSSLSPHNLLLDIDVHLTDNLTPDNSKDKFTRAAHENLRILAEYKKYLDL